MGQARSDAGLREVLVSRNHDDPDEAIVIFEATDPAVVEHYMRGDGLRDAWRRGGVIPESNQVTLLDSAPRLD
ncbi:MAG: hypothetical protein ACRD0P_16415, partial [Stackebrandtia sp.]